MMGNVASVDVRGKKLLLTGGNCQTTKVIYIAFCTQCTKIYIGKTVNELRIRINWHRGHMKNITNVDKLVDDTNCLASHAVKCHNMKDNNDFNALYRFSIVQVVNDPKSLLRREKFFINEYKSSVPLGLNFANPIGLQALLAMK